VSDEAGDIPPEFAKLVASIEREPVDEAAMAAITKESGFTRIALGLLIEAASYVLVGANTRTMEKWDRDHAAVGGNMVRLSKLLDAIMDQTTQQRRETGVLLARCAWETTVSVRFLMANFSPATVDSYVEYSMRHERKLRNQILSRIEGRGGEVLPIEQRMLRSIARAASFGGIDLDTPEKKGPWGGRNTFEKAQDIGVDEQFLAIFGGPSHEVHGSWQNLYQYHLDATEIGQFEAEMGWQRPRPQVLIVLAMIVVDTVRSYFDFLNLPELSSVLKEPLNDLYVRLRRVNTAHENFLIAKAVPGDPDAPG